MAAAGGGGAPRALSEREQDIQMMLAADVQLGTKNCDFQMERYVSKRRTDGIYIINLDKTWEKLQLAARDVAIENPQDIIVQSARPYGQPGAHAIAGRHTPGARNCDFQMQRYTYIVKRLTQGTTTNIINLDKTWEKFLQLEARANVVGYVQVAGKHRRRAGEGVDCPQRRRLGGDRCGLRRGRDHLR